MMERKMKYSLIDPVLEAQIAGILLKIRLSMNGIVSGHMTQSGIIYKTNYGVTIPRIKEIAAGYSPNHELAQRLWAMQIRETMIMATLLQPVEKFTAGNALEWVTQFNQIEIVEQTCMSLFCKLPFADALILKWIQSEDIWEKITGFILAARIINKLSRDQIKVILSKAIEISDTDDLHLYKAVGLCLSRLCRKDKETAALILNEIESIDQTPSVGQQYISAEVKQEILFLDIL